MTGRKTCAAGRVTMATAGAVLAGAALAGCSSSDGDEHQDQKPDTKALVSVATRYQEAVNEGDWRTACRLSGPELRRGSVPSCADRHAKEEPSEEPSEEASPSPSESAAAPTYADGSTPPPPATQKPSHGPERASVGAVKAAGSPERVAASGTHSAGYGVLVRYRVRWPDETSTVQRALRVVEHDGRWLVVQREDLSETDGQQGDPIRAALSRE